MRSILRSIRKTFSHPSSFYVREAIIELTNRCNLRCKRCNIWKEAPKRDLDMNVFRNLLKSESFRYVEIIALTGGEPFLLDNLGEYVSAIKKMHPKAFIHLSTNGFEKDKILKFLDDYGTARLRISISFDGLGVHDELRGMQGSERSILVLVDSLKKNYPRLVFDIKFLLGDMNSNYLEPTADYFNSKGMPFNIKVVESANHFQNRSRECPDSLSSPSIIETSIGKVKNRTYAGRLMRGERKSCSWPRDRLFILSDYEVYLCYKKNSLGNLKQMDIDSMIKKGYIKKKLDEMMHCSDSGCYPYTIR